MYADKNVLQMNASHAAWTEQYISNVY